MMKKMTRLRKKGRTKLETKRSERKALKVADSALLQVYMNRCVTGNNGDALLM